MGGLDRPHRHDQGLGQVQALRRQGLGRASPSTASSTACPASPSSTGCTTGRTGSTRPASAGRPRPSFEMAEIAEKLTDPAKNRYGFGLRGGCRRTEPGHRRVPRLREQDRRGRQAGDGPARRLIEALDWYSGLYTKLKVCPPSAPNDSYRQIMEGFKTGQTAMIWHHTGSLTELQKAMKPEPAHDRDPAGGPGGALCARHLPVQRHHGSRIDADAGWDWLTFWSETDAGIAFLEETGYFPSNPEIAKDDRDRQEPDLRGGGRDDRIRPAAAALHRRPGLGGDGRAARVPEDPGRSDHASPMLPTRSSPASKRRCNSADPARRALQGSAPALPSRGRTMPKALSEAQLAVLPRARRAVPAAGARARTKSRPARAALARIEALPEPHARRVVKNKSHLVSEHARGARSASPPSSTRSRT